ncbi:hypothetical protein [uncultured Roseobacter sp.]|uniref:hypothetical protein n=1 Tax=uncultured Roseobacter sp. TaxID=114847 RepID=UPI00263747EE|nr:hypothetical protein [uncultured Roseobacter sp.]
MWPSRRKWRAQEDTSRGYRGIIGELSAAVSCLSDPTLWASLSAPFDASLADLCSSERTYQMYLMCPIENIDGWDPVIKSVLASAKLLKSRHPQAARQTWVLDEAAQKHCSMTTRCNRVVRP